MYLILAIFSLTPLIWFLDKGGAIVNGVDTNFPLNPLIWFVRRFFVWNPLPNGGADHSSSISGLFFHLIQVIPDILGFNLQTVQVISFVFWFSLITFSSFWFARTLFGNRRWPTILFVCFYVFNIFAFNAWENSKVATLSLLAAIPIFLSIVTLLIQGRVGLPRGFFLSSLAGIVASGTGVNPAYFISLVLIVFIYGLGYFLTEVSRKSFLLVARGILIILISLILVNSFWILPTYSYVSKNVAAEDSIEQIGFTNWVDSLSENTSLLNVMRIQGAWDWYAFDSVSGTPLYIPYALNYFKKIPFIVFSFLIPSLALISFIFFDMRHSDKKRKALYISFGLMLVLGIFLGSGTHPPTGEAFRFLLEKIPFFSLFRSPWYIFTPLVVVSYAGLLPLLFEKIEDRCKRFARIGIAVLVVGNLFYSYPLVTGKIFRPSRSDGFYIKFPTYVFDFAKKLKNLNDDKRILGYPDDEIEQFEWGYRGIESILSLFSNKETVFLPLNNQRSSVPRITKLVYSGLKKGRIKAAGALAAKLNVGYVFEKSDQNSLSPVLPASLKIDKVVGEGRWNLFAFERRSVEKIFSPTGFFFVKPYLNNENAMSLMKGTEVAVSSSDSVVDDIPSIISSSGSIVSAENSQARDFRNMTYAPSELSKRLVKRDMSKVMFDFDIDKDGFYSPALENFRLDNFGLLKESLSAKIDGQNVSLEVNTRDDSFVHFKPMFLSKGSHSLGIDLANPNLISGTTSVMGITNTGAFDILEKFEIPDFDYLNPYLIQLNYRHVYGNNGLVQAIQKTDETLVRTQNERLPDYPESKSFSFFYEPVLTESSLSVYLVAPQTKDPLGTKVFYDNLEVHRVFMNNLFFVEKGIVLTTPKVEFTKKSPVAYAGSVLAGRSHTIVFAENYSPEWEMKIFDSNRKVLPIKPLHFSANYYANAWYVDGAPENYKFVIYYKPQKLLVLGGIISGLTLVGSFIYFLLKKKT